MQTQGLPQGFSHFEGDCIGQPHRAMPSHEVGGLERRGHIDVLIELLLAVFTAMNAVGGTWPVISEELQKRCLARIRGRARFIEGLAPPQVEAAIRDTAVKQAEAFLLAHALDVMRRQGWLGIGDDTQSTWCSVASTWRSASLRLQLRASAELGMEP
jgi:hypothetical protein